MDLQKKASTTYSAWDGFTTMVYSECKQKDSAHPFKNITKASVI